MIIFNFLTLRMLPPYHTLDNLFTNEVACIQFLLEQRVFYAVNSLDFSRKKAPSLEGVGGGLFASEASEFSTTNLATIILLSTTQWAEVHYN